jgi:hypothetical protein
MSEHEQHEQIGKLIEELSQAKGRLAHVNESLPDFRETADASPIHQHSFNEGDRWKLGV